MQTFKIEKNDTQCVVTVRYFHVSIVFFLLLWLTFWTPCCVGIAHVVYDDQRLVPFLFAVFFYGCWFLGFTSLVNVLFGNTRIVLNETGLESIWTCLFFKRKKRIDLTDIHRFEKIVDTGEGTGSWNRSYQFRVVCQGKNATYYCFPSYEKEVEALCNHLNVFLETLKR